MVMEHILGQMVEHIRVNGKIIKWMARVNLLGLVNKFNKK